MQIYIRIGSRNSQHFCKINENKSELCSTGRDSDYGTYLNFASKNIEIYFEKWRVNCIL